MILASSFVARNEVDNAIEKLKAEGFIRTDISVISEYGVNQQALKVGVVDWIGGFGVYDVPDDATYLAVGPITGAIVSYGRVRAALHSFGIEQGDSTKYKATLAAGQTLVTVHCDTKEWLAKARGIMQDTGASHIAEAA